jgi:hypothetical protein
MNYYLNKGTTLLQLSSCFYDEKINNLDILKINNLDILKINNLDILKIKIKL